MAEQFPPGALLAVDVGTVRMGVAACDTARILAYPVTVVPSDDAAVNTIAGLIAEHGAVAVIVGLPLTLGAEQSFAAQGAISRARDIQAGVDVPVWLVDERMTTAQAAKKLRAAGRTTRRARPVIDAVAAVGILESVMEAAAHHTWIGQRIEDL